MERFYASRTCQQRCAMSISDMDLVADWAAFALSGVNGQPYVGLDCAPIAGGASSREYFRVRDTLNSWVVLVGRGAPGEYLAMPVTCGAERDFFEIGSFLRRNGVVVPEIIHADFDKNWLLVEDFGDVSLEQACVGQAPDARATLYRTAMEMLLPISASTANARKKGICAARRALDVDTLVWEMRHFVDWWLDAEGHAPNAADRAFMDGAFQKLAGELSESGHVLVHRDFHSKNLMVLGGRTTNIGVIDFQDAALGAPTYDLASLLLDCFVDLDWKHIDAAVAEFHQMLITAGLSCISAANFKRQFIVQGLQRSMKAAGRHNCLAHRWERPEDRLAARRGIARVARLLQSYEDFHPLRHVLGRYLPALLSFE